MKRDDLKMTDVFDDVSMGALVNFLNHKDAYHLYRTDIKNQLDRAMRYIEDEGFDRDDCEAGYEVGHCLDWINQVNKYNEEEGSKYFAFTIEIWRERYTEWLEKINNHVEDEDEDELLLSETCIDIQEIAYGIERQLAILRKASQQCDTFEMYKTTLSFALNGKDLDRLQRACHTAFKIDARISNKEFRQSEATARLKSSDK